MKNKKLSIGHKSVTVSYDETQDVYIVTRYIANIVIGAQIVRSDDEELMSTILQLSLIPLPE